MKVKEFRVLTAGFMAGQKQSRVRTLAKDEPKPEGAEQVPADTPETDWIAVEEGG
jgi:hypothetical protein